MTRAAIFNLFVSKYFVLMIITASAVLSYFTGGLGYLVGIIVALIAFWASGFSWKEFGISRPQWMKTIYRALAFSALIFLVIDIVIQPIIEKVFGQIDLKSLDGLRGNLTAYLLFVLFMWVVAGFGEEFLYRGYFMRRLAILFGDTDKGWILSALIISTLFGLAHLYQGLSGVIATGLVGFILAMIFYKNRTNLVLGMLTHGFYDMIGLTLIYFSKEKVIFDWMDSHVM